jgi:ATP-dependent helicase HrpA
MGMQITYPPDLPITERVPEIAAAIRDHQVVIVAGETGSGKTTQLPKVCLQVRDGVPGMIGHTQPRRLAARTVADRIAEELGTAVGAGVGYQVRFTDRVSDDTVVKLMTDGILLTELGRDRLLRRYHTLIIDEAHERSLNVDFILGYLTRLLPRRPDLKVVITSATIDPQRFSRHFDDAPVIEVSGRTYPVEIRYRPLLEAAADPAGDPDASAEDPGAGDELRDQAQAVCDAVDELSTEGPGDILVFLSGEREIRDTADALRAHLSGERGVPTEILPLYARLSMAEQHRAFQPHPGRRIVLATNVAETSLTVPGIRYVIDPGTARISRYSHRLKVQRLPIEPVSQASARQRAGRCGRVADGVCVRLFSEADYDARPAFTEPEILRTNLASVILQMTALGLGDVADFPFLDPPDRRQIADGVRLLEELGALDSARRLTPLGRKLAQLPVDPRLGRMVLAADQEGCLREVTVIAAALSIQDPRERPTDRQEQARQAHARFAAEGSDFLAYLNLWHHLQEQQKERSSSGFRRMCRAEFLNYLRVREWQDVHQQLRRVARTLGASLNGTPAEPRQVHTALLSGLLSHIGTRDVTTKDPRRRHEYAGARGSRFAIAPGSVLFRASPRWVMVAELVETSRLWGRIAAAIEPEWVEPLAGHLVRRGYSEPHWEKKRGSVVAYEKVTLYGLPIVAQRKVNYGRIDPALSRELFIRHALVEGDWDAPHEFLRHNRELIAQVEELEHRARRRDILVDDQTLFELYDARVGAQVVSGAHFDSWWKKTRRGQPDLLTFTTGMLLRDAAGRVSEADFPGTWPHGGLDLPLTYQFEPGAAADGVTVHVPLALLDRVADAGFDWQVPGLRRDLVIALIRSLPKPLRRVFVPVPDVADEVLARLAPYREPLLPALARELHRLGGVAVPPDAWQPEKVPDHLRITIRVTDTGDATVAEGKDLAVLRARLRPAAAASLSAAAADVERRGLRTWSIGTLPRQVELRRGGHALTAYPALTDAGESADVRVFGGAAAQRHHHRRGVRRLLLLAVASPVAYVSARLADEAKLTLLRNPHGGVRALLDDCAACAVDALVAEHGGPPWDEAGFAALAERVRGELNRATLGVVTQVLPILTLAHEVAARLSAHPPAALAAAWGDLRAQLDGLVPAGFVAATGWARLPDLPRYLRGMQRRLERAGGNPERDRQFMVVVQELTEEYADLRARAGDEDIDALEEVRWMIEELRISFFAQALGTPYPVSEKRVWRAFDAIGGDAT